MARLNLLTTVLPMALGVGLYVVGQGFGTQGDLAKALGRPDDALTDHLVAAGVTATAAACFLFAIIMAIKGWLVAPKPGRAKVAGAPSEPVEEAFDADAIIQRYLAARDAPPAVPPQAFGRKQQ